MSNTWTPTRRPFSPRCSVKLAHGRYAASEIYFRADTSQRMVDLLAGLELYTQKRFFEATPATVTAGRERI